MKSTNIILNKKTWNVAISSTTPSDSAIILSHEEILAGLPDLIRHDAVAEAVKNILLKGMENFASVELPMVGRGKIAVEIKKSMPDDHGDTQSLLLAEVSRSLFSKQATKALGNAKISSIYALAMHNQADLLKYRGMGNKSFNEIKDFLAAHNLNDQKLLHKLQQKHGEVYSTLCANIDEVAVRLPYQDLKDMIKSLDNIEQITVAELYDGRHSSFLIKAFPFRHPGNDFAKTKYEEQFPHVNDQEHIINLAKEIESALHAHYDSQMRAYISEMDVRTLQ